MSLLSTLKPTFVMLTDEEKITYLLKSQKQLTKMMKQMKSRTVNLTWTYYKEKEKIMRHMIGISICCRVAQTWDRMRSNGILATKLSVETMQILQWASEIALTP
ncbi:unnamed protein product [Rhizophagus irregularis]|nr:unnamed protein product [Rhizophagus irregularis]